MKINALYIHGFMGTPNGGTYTALKNYYKQQQFFKKKYKINYKKYALEPIKNRYGKITEYQIVESKYKIYRKWILYNEI